MSTLAELHKILHAVPGMEDGASVVASYGDDTAEARAVRERAGVSDLSHRGLLRLAGADRARFLQAMATSDVTVATTGRGVYGALLNDKGRVVSDFTCFADPDHLLLDVEAAAREKLPPVFDRYIIMDDVTVEDITQKRTLLAVRASSSLVGTCYVPQMPVFARDVLHGSSDLFGYLMAAIGAGALMGALGVSRLPREVLTRVPFAASAGFGLSLVAFSQSSVLWLSWLLLVPAGFGMMAMGIATNTLIQGSIADAMRGRVMAYYVMAFIGMMPLSALIAGWVSHQIGAPDTLATGGALCVVAAGVAYWRR